MKAKRDFPVSKHFRIEQLAEGVYAAIHQPGGSAIGNAGIVYLGDRTLVYDTFMSPIAAEDLRAAAEALTGRPVDTVVDSHWHNDHIWGNQAFDAETDIIATDETRRQFIATRGHGAYDAFMAAAENNLESTRSQLAAATDDFQRKELSLWVDYHQTVVDLKPILQIRPPSLTFTDRLALHGRDRTVELIEYAGGHTESDVVLFLAEEGVVFMSDLLFIDFQPYLGGGDPDRVLAALDAVSALAPKLLVPGHGPVGAPECLAGMAGYIRTLGNLAREMVENGVAEEIIDGMAAPPPYDEWLFAAFFPVNMHYLYQRHAQEQQTAMV